jgi:DNA-binding protein H-NS
MGAVMKLANELGLTANDLSNIGNAMRRHIVQYRDPKNPANTWNDMGNRPKWMKAALASGASLASFKVVH